MQCYKVLKSQSKRKGIASATEALAHVHEELGGDTQHTSQQTSRDGLLYTVRTGEGRCFERQIFSSAHNDVLPTRTECQRCCLF